MAGESPGGGSVEAGGGECIEAKLLSAGVDVVSDSLQGVEVGDLVDGMASLLKQSLVDDDAKRLVAVADGEGLAIFALQVEGVGGHLVHDGGAVQRIAVLAVGVDGALVAALEEGRSGALVKLGGQGGVIGAGSGGDDLDGHAGLRGVGLSDLLPGFVSFRLEVQVVDGAGSGRRLFGLLGRSLFRLLSGGVFCGLLSFLIFSRSLGGLLSGRAGDQSENHGQSKK